MTDVIAKPLSIFESSWRTGEVPENSRKASVTPVFKKGKKEIPRNRLLSLTPIPDNHLGYPSDNLLGWHDQLGR